MWYALLMVGMSFWPLSDEGLAEKLDEYLRRMELLGFSGNVLIARGDEVLLSKGYGLADREAGTKATPETVISMGSISKHFTAAAILKLEMDERLAVTDPIEYYFDNVPADKRDITLHHLLSHTSGLAAAAGLGDAPDRDAFVQNTLSTELHFPPGRAFLYSNLGFGLLAAVVEVITEMPFEEYLRDELLLPAGMEQTGAALPEWKQGTIAAGYVDGESIGSMLGGSLDWTNTGSGGLHTTPLDMWKWNQALDAESVLSAEALAKMMKPQGPRDSDTGYGYGTGIRRTDHGTRWMGHNGSNDIFSADFRRYPEDHLFVYAAGNNADAYSFDITPELEKLLFGEEVAWPPEVVPQDAVVLARLAGEYQLASGGLIHVEARGATLQIWSDDADGGVRIFPTDHERRRESLLHELPRAYEAAFAGEWDALHQLLDPLFPRDRFIARQQEILAEVQRTAGKFRRARAIPGRDRFGEVCVQVVLDGERGQQMIEYSFGDQEVGSIRFTDRFPSRSVRPLSPTRFVAYDARSKESWAIEFDGEEGRESLHLANPTESFGTDIARRRP